MMKRYGRWQGWNKNNDFIRTWKYKELIYVEINNNMFDRKSFNSIGDTWSYVKGYFEVK